MLSDESTLPDEITFDASNMLFTIFSTDSGESKTVDIILKG